MKSRCPAALDSFGSVLNGPSATIVIYFVHDAGHLIVEHRVILLASVTLTDALS